MRWLAAALIALLAAAVRPDRVLAFSCTWTGNGGNTDWTNSANWSACNDGTPGSADAAIIPGGATSYPVVSADLTVGAVTIQDGGVLTYSADAGTFAITTFTIQDGGKYVHDRAAGSPLLASGGTRSFSNSSTVEIQRWVSSGSGVPAAFGNLIVNNSSFIQFGGNLTTVNGSLTKQGSGELRLAGTTSVSLTVGGDLDIQGGTVTVQSSSTANSAAIAVAGDVSIGAGTTLQRGDGASTWTFGVGGDWTNSGAFTPGASKVVFNGSGTSTISGSSTTTFYDLEISSNTTLDVSTNTLFDATNSVRNYGRLKQTRTVGVDNVAFLNLSSGKYYGVEVDPSGSTSMGDTTVTVYGEQTCPTPPSLGVTTIKRCFDIAPTTATTATVKFWYDATNELNSNSQGSEKAYYQEDGLWHEATGTYARAAGAFNSVQVSDMSVFSRFALTSNTPSESNLITLARFTAIPAVGGGVLIGWETAGEIGTAGFHLWRSERADGGYARITPALVPGRGGPTRGATYTFTDRHALPGRVYYYRLEEVALSGLSTLHGPTGPVIGLADGPVFRMFFADVES